MPNFGPLRSEPRRCRDALLGVVGIYLAAVCEASKTTRSWRIGDPRLIAGAGVRERVGRRADGTMATDKSEPRVGLDLQGRHPGQSSRWSPCALRSSPISTTSPRPRSSASSARSSRRRSTSLRADERQRLAGGAMPIENAMQQIASARSDERQPRDHADRLARTSPPLQGWTEDARRRYPARWPFRRTPARAPRRRSRVDGGTLVGQRRGCRASAAAARGAETVAQNHP